MGETIQNANKLHSKIASIADGVADKYIEKAVANGLQPVQATAKLLVPVGTIGADSNGGLRESIKKRTERTASGARGEVYTNASYAAYVELGTGPRGDQNHKDISPNVNPTYTMEPWWIHESQIDEKIAEKYKWYYIDTEQGRFYQCLGQPAQPFMYPALERNEKNVTKRIGTYLAKKIREEAKK